MKRNYRAARKQASRMTAIPEQSPIERPLRALTGKVAA